MAKAAHDWDICSNCTHTVNIHDDNGVCHAYKCTCEEFELKKGKER